MLILKLSRSGKVIIDQFMIVIEENQATPGISYSVKSGLFKEETYCEFKVASNVITPSNFIDSIFHILTFL